jgi:hypothetical protein
MRQELAFARRMRDGEGRCGCHGLAEKFPRICHAAVRLNSYAAFSRASSDSESKQLGRLNRGTCFGASFRIAEAFTAGNQLPVLMQGI